MTVAPQTVTVGGHTLLLRCAEESDAAMLLDYLRTVCGETRFLLRTKEEITFSVEEEKQFIREQNESSDNVMLLAFFDGEYAGNASLTGTGTLRQRHHSELGIALFQRFTGLGIGTVLIKKLLEIAKAQGKEFVELSVNAENTGAVALYERLGFETVGRFPKYDRYDDGTYGDLLVMFRSL